MAAHAGMQHDDAGGEQRSSHYAAEIRCGEALCGPSANPGSPRLRWRDEYRWAEGRYDRLPALAADLVAPKVNVISSFGHPSATLP
jgi:hypothetical protein